MSEWNQTRDGLARLRLAWLDYLKACRERRAHRLLMRAYAIDPDVVTAFGKSCIASFLDRLPTSETAARTNPDFKTDFKTAEQGQEKSQ